MSDEELIQRAIDGEILGNGRTQIEALLRRFDKSRLLACNMTEAEADVMSHLVQFWNAFVELPGANGASSTKTVCEAVNLIQGILAIRVLSRLDPSVWRA